MLRIAKQKVLNVRVDFSKAFDSIKSMTRILLNYGITDKVKAIAIIYENP